MSTVDVVVPCYRYANYLRECVHSVLSQEGVDVRVMIIDDASPDNTADVGSDLAARDSRVTFHRHASNRGHINTYNEGLEWASASYVLLLSADDYLLPNALRSACKLMDEHSSVGFTFGNAIESHANGDRVRSDTTQPLLRGMPTRVVSGRDFILASGPHNLVPTPTAVVRTTMQKHVGGYRHELPHTGDMELWLRLAAQSDVGVIGDDLAVYRRHSANMSAAYYRSSRLPDLQEREAALSFFFRDCAAHLDNAEEIRQEMLNALAIDAVICANGAFHESEMALVDQLAHFALRISPVITRNMAWKKLRLKRLLGPKRWHALKPAIAALRKGEDNRRQNAA
jgi:glycosyltransferase involved in cell wall biosynthesis